MSNMNELSAALEAIRGHAQGILDEVESIRGMFSETGAQPVRTCTLAEVRAALARIMTAGHREEVRALLTARGAEKLTDLDPACYAALMQEAEAIGE